MRPEEFDTWEQEHLVSDILSDVSEPFSRKDILAKVKQAYSFIAKETVLKVLHEFCGNGYILFREVEEGQWMYVPVLKDDGFADNGMYTPTLYDTDGNPV